MVVDDDQPADIPDTATSDHKKSTLEVTNLTPPSGPSPTLSGGTVEPDIEDGKGTPDSLAKYNTRDPVGDEKEGGGNKSHRDDAFRTRTLTRGNGSNECNDSGIRSDASTSVGQSTTSLPNLRRPSAWLGGSRRPLVASWDTHAAMRNWMTKISYIRRLSQKLLVPHVVDGSRVIRQKSSALLQLLLSGLYYRDRHPDLLNGCRDGVSDDVSHTDLIW